MSYLKLKQEENLIKSFKSISFKKKEQRKVEDTFYIIEHSITKLIKSNKNCGDLEDLSSHEFINL